eukprot:3696803-Rhodomonas_salina.1
MASRQRLWNLKALAVEARDSTLNLDWTLLICQCCGTGSHGATVTAGPRGSGLEVPGAVRARPGRLGHHRHTPAVTRTLVCHNDSNHGTVDSELFLYFRVKGSESPHCGNRDSSETRNSFKLPKSVDAQQDFRRGSC